MKLLILILLVFAFVLFVCAAFPLNTKLRLEWLAFAALTLAYILGSQG